METKKKKLGAFRFGDYYIPFLYFFEKLGYEVIVPPEDERSLLRGIQNSPDTICLPFRFFLGEYIEDLENGAELLFSFAGRGIRKGKRGGACRLDFYPEMHRQILHELGYKFEMLPFRMGLTLWKKLREHNSFFESINIIRVFLERLMLFEYIRDLSYRYRPYEKEKGAATKIYLSLLNKLKDRDSMEGLNNLRKEAERAFENMQMDMTRSIFRLPFIGEWGVQNIPFLNKGMDVLLGEAGVEAGITMKVSDFLFGSGSLLTRLVNFVIKRKELRSEIIKKAKPYMGHYVGGMGQEAVGYAVFLAQNGYDGAIHMMPDTCMPEIIAKTALANIEHDFNFPILYVTLDENTKREDLEKKVRMFVESIKERRKRVR